MENQINNNYREQAASNRPATSSSTNKPEKKPFKNTLLFKILTGIAALLVLAAIVLGAKALLGSPSEASQLDDSKYQAVFLDGGQVYFGKINTINAAYVELNDVYYLNVNSQDQAAAASTSSDNVSLVKLGCELHGPNDKMVINRTSVSFWENLKTDAQVTTAIKQWKEQNPKGQDCSKSGTGSQTQAPATDTQPAAGAGTGTDTTQ